MAVQVGTFDGWTTYVDRAPSFERWPEAFSGLRGQQFVLLVLGDATTVDDAVLLEVARRALRAGCRYACAWGPDCLRVERAFDRVIVDELFRDEPETEDTVIITTSHERESLEQALWYFRRAALPAAAYERTCLARLAVAVGSEEWSAAAIRILATPDGADA